MYTNEFSSLIPPPPKKITHSRVWDVGMGQCLKTLFADGSPAVCVHTILIVPEARMDFNDTATNTQFHDKPQQTPIGSSHVRFSPSGRHLLAGFLDSALRLWSVESPSKCVRTYRCVAL